MAAKWMSFNELPFGRGGSPLATVFQLGERLLTGALTAESSEEFLANQLPEVATEFPAQWVAILQRTPEWQQRAACGRHKPETLPYGLFIEALDREAAGQETMGNDRSILTVPLRSGSAAGTESWEGCVLVVAGRKFGDEALPAGLLIGRVLSIALSTIDTRTDASARVKRLEGTLRMASSLSGAVDTTSLLTAMAEEATSQLDCDRSSIFIHDADRGEMVACPALGVQGGQLRLPDNAGIVGEALRTGKSIRVDDAYEDARFSPDADLESGYQTKNLLCVPLRDSEGRLIGVFEGINKRDSHFTKADEETLLQLGLLAAVTLKNLKERQQLVRSRDQLEKRVTSDVRIVGESAAIVALRDTISRLASTDLPVLILGESGTGKEVVSQALHFEGLRSSQPFVAVNCAALTETLLESELFGHERGAFTDAHEERLGKFELADGGTLFLDEIGDMSIGGQAKLLRVLEQKVITRVGGSQAIPINVRVVASTNTKLNEAVQEKRFREDLYYRLSVVTLELPPVRDRPEDILPLSEHFLRHFAQQARRPELKLTSEARRRLQAHSWPGNVRELRNLMERVAFLCPSERIEAEDLAFILSPERDSFLEPSLELGLEKATRQFQREFIRRSVKRVNGNMSEAARLLGLHRSNLYRKMRHLEMKEVSGESG